MTASDIAVHPLTHLYPSKPVAEHALASRLFADRVLMAANMVMLALGLALVLGLFLYYVGQSEKALYFTPYSLLEEAAYTFTSANNYLRFGYLNSGLLQDFSSSLNPADHPYVYNHMPPGPDLLTSALLWVFRGDYDLVRVSFATIMLAGVGVYLVFARDMLRHLGVRFFGVVPLLITPWVIIQLFDRQIYSPFPLLAFLPLVLVIRFFKNNRRSYLIAALCVIAVSAIYIEYSLLSAIIFCWAMLYFMQLLPLKFRHMVLIGSAFGLGIAAHLVQNLLYLGWDAFALEFKLAISNRMTGFPTQAELKDFYHQLGLVHHGSRPIEPGVLSSQISANFSLPATPAAKILLFSCVLWIFFGRGIRFSPDNAQPIVIRNAIVVELWLVLRLVAWVVITVLAPIILFPAFAQEVNLRGVGNVFFLAIPFAFLAGHGIWVLAYGSHRALSVLADPGGVPGRPAHDITEPDHALLKLGVFVGRAIALIGIGLALMDGSIAVARNVTNELSYIHRLGQNADRLSHLYDIRRFQGELFMTNINVPTVGFLTSTPGFGVCSPDSVKQDGGIDLRECKTSFMRRHDYWLQQRPRYFFYFSLPQFFPAFADCLPADTLIGSKRGGDECMKQLLDRLESQFPLVLQNDLVSVFDISQSREGRKGN